MNSAVTSDVRIVIDLICRNFPSKATTTVFYNSNSWSVITEHSFYNSDNKETTVSLETCFILVGGNDFDIGVAIAVAVAVACLDLLVSTE